MKSFDEHRIRQAESAQLIILHSLFSSRESREVIFQGGTAIRWFYGGLRFSEDLDFVASLSRERIAELVRSAGPRMQRQLTGDFGSGIFSVKEKKSRQSSWKAFIDFAPSAMRGKISVKIEFEVLAPGMRPDTDRVIMQGSPAVSGVLREGNLRTLGPPVVINIETPGEILSDKLRALMERPHTRGRDFFDIWFLSQTLGETVDIHGLRRKLDIYEAPFSIATPPSFYANLEKAHPEKKKLLLQDIGADLARFLGKDSLDVFQQNGFRDLLKAVQDAFRQVIDTKVINFKQYPSRKNGVQL